MLNISELRKEYKLKTLDLKDLHSDPFLQFQTWFQDAQQSQLIEPNAMILATASLQAKPSSRTVLLKGIDQKGLLFFTNYNSRKSQELDANPYASVTFLWKELERQVTIEGAVEKTSRLESQNYFASRPWRSQLSSCLSQQGKPLASRLILEEQFQLLEQTYQGREIPLPSFWGGYRLLPSRFEFWQGRENRLHDRFQYSRDKNQGWNIERLAP